MFLAHKTILQNYGKVQSSPKQMTEVFPKTLTAKQAVISTLAYFDLFETPLTRDEIMEHLFFATADEEKIDIYLRESPLIIHNDGYYALKGNKHIFENFEYKKKRSKNYWKKVKRYNFIFSLCPFLELAAVCNSLPIGDVEENSDIDLFIIARKDKLFTVRIFLTLLCQLFGVRRYGNKIKKRFCLSFYVTESMSDLKEIAQEPYDIYLAYWTKTIEPIAGDYNRYEEFLNNNQHWMSKYFHRIDKRKRYFRKRSEKIQKWKEKLEEWLGNPKIEDYLKKWQLKRANEKLKYLSDPSGTILKEDILKFHDQDIRKDIRRDWVKRMNELL